MSRSRTAYAQRTEPERELSEAEALERLRTIQPRMMPRNTPSELAKHYSEGSRGEGEERTALPPRTPMPASTEPGASSDHLHGRHPASLRADVLHPQQEQHSHSEASGEGLLLEDSQSRSGENVSTEDLQNRSADVTPRAERTAAKGPSRSSAATPRASNLTVQIPDARPLNNNRHVPRRSDDVRNDPALLGTPRPIIQPSPTSAEKSRPMKHLTCYYWANSLCKYHPDDCLYAHEPTGHVANAPILIEPGRSIAGENVQRYFNNDPVVFRDHRSAHGLPSRRATITDPRRPRIDPFIQQQIDNITAKQQHQQLVEDCRNFTDSPQAQLPPAWNPGPPIYYNPYAMSSPFSPDQASSAGIFSPHPTLMSPNAPTYSRDDVGHNVAPASEAVPLGPSYEDLQSEVEHLKAENGLLRAGNNALIKYLLGTLYISQQNALFTRDVLQREGKKLIALAQPLLSQLFHDRWNWPHGWGDVSKARNGLVAVGQELLSNTDKKIVHAREMSDLRKQVRVEIEKTGDEIALAAWDTGKSAWPYEKRIMNRELSRD